MRAFFNHYKSFVLVAFVITCFFRFFFFFLNDVDTISILFQGIIYDALFLLSLYGLLTPIGYLVFKVSSRVFFAYNWTILVLLCIAEYATEVFYYTQNTHLGRSIVYYSVSDLILISRTSESNTFSAILCAFLALVFSVLSFLFFRKIKIKRVTISLCLILIVAISQFVLSNFLFGESKTRNIAVPNKTAYLLNALIIKSSDGLEVDRELFTQSFENRDYFDESYPLAFRDSITESKLSPYFIRSKEKPNIVFIVVESLSRYISGENSTFPSLTPFLDSLSNESLVWNNCVSSCERTFGALPGLLGSLPYGEKGFSYLAGNMPDHISLVNVLEKNGYQSNFYYGGDIGFDNTEIFLNRERFTNIESGDYIKKNGQVYWGLSDSLMFDKSLKNYERLNPQLHVYLTLSTHGPFDFEGKNKIRNYLKESYLDKINYDKLSKNFRDSQDLLGSFYYADLQVKHLINKLKKTPGFDKTIFIITGDHGLPLVKTDNRLKRYHVPLIIYSPLLKKSQRFKSLVSHLDIYPTLQKVLNTNFGLKIPEVSYFIGEDIDTNTHFSSNRQIPLMTLDRLTLGLIKDTLFVFNKQLFRIHDNLNMITEVKNGIVKQELLSELQSFKMIDSYVSEENKIVPKELAKNWITSYKLSESKTLPIEDNKVEFLNIMSKNHVKQEGYIKIEVDILLTDTLKDKTELPRIVLSVKEAKSNRIYIDKDIIEEFEHYPTNPELTTTISIETLLPQLQSSSEGLQILVYAWNKHNIEMPIQKVNYRYFIEE